MSRMMNLTTPTTATVTVVTSGTPVQGATSTQIPPGVEVLVRAHPDNTGTITVAGSSAAALNTSSTCERLLAHQSITYQVQNTNQLWFDATVSGEKVLLTYML